MMAAPLPGGGMVGMRFALGSDGPTAFENDVRRRSWRRLARDRERCVSADRGKLAQIRAEAVVIRFYPVLVMLVAAACAQSTSAESLQGGRDADASANELAGDIAGVYHLPLTVDSINLELRDDHRFRWSLRGCDTFGGGSGRFDVTSATTIVLVPDAGHASFPWPGAGVMQMTEVRLGVTSDKLIDDGGFDRQIWESGGVCPKCGSLGPVGQQACDDPFQDG